MGERFENADDDEARRRLTFFALLLDAGAVGAGRGDLCFCALVANKVPNSIVSIVSFKGLFNWVKKETQTTDKKCVRF